jgi:hypothetical protein
VYTNSLLASLNARSSLAKLIQEKSGNTMSISLRGLPKNGQVNLIQVFISSGFYITIPSSVKLYLLKSIPPSKITILVMTKNFMMQVWRTSWPSVFFHFRLCDNQNFLTSFFLISRWTMQKFFPTTKKDARLLLSINIQVVNFKVVLEFSKLASKNKHPPNAFNYQQT